MMRRKWQYNDPMKRSNLRSIEKDV